MTVERMDKAVSKIIRYISYLSVVGLVGIMVVAFVNMVIEKVFHTGIPGSTEIIQYLHVPVVFFAVAWVTFDREHVKIDFLTSRAPKWLQSALMYFAYALCLLISGFVAVRGVYMTQGFIEQHKMSTTGLLGFPLWPFGVIFTIGGFLLSFSFFWMIVRGIKKINPVRPDGFDEGSNAEKEVQNGV